MLTKLDFSVEFASTGKIITGYHEFKPGMTAITGPNESGKSIRLEMIRYALFGVKALRAPSASYKSIKATLEFKVNGVSYIVTRSPNSCSVVKDGKMIANGVKATNMAMLDTFGYNLDVFDTANAICQKQAEALTAKTPADRKKMVDKVIGLNAVDEMIDEVGEEMSVIRGSITAQAKFVGEEPIAPVKPTAYCPSYELKKTIQVVREREMDRVQLEAYLQASFTEEPKKPKGEPVSATVIQSLMEEKMKFDYDHKRLADCITVLNKQEKEWEQVDAEWTMALQQASIEERKKYVAEFRGGAFERHRKWVLERAGAIPPEVPPDMLVLMHQIISNDEIKSKLAHLETDGIKCPHCHKDFFLQQDRINELKAQLVPVDHEEITRNVMSRLGIKQHYHVEAIEQQWQKYDAVMTAKEPSLPEGPDLGSERNVQESIEQHARMLERRDKFIQLGRDVEVYKLGLNDREDPTERLFIAREAESEWNKYNAEADRHQKYLKTKAEIDPKLAALVTGYNLPELEGSLSIAEQYERDLHQYNNDWTKYEFAQIEMKESEAVLERLTLVRKALQDIKPKVKSYLMPSLNRVASNLISQMTNGARNKIEISENFDIKADGQHVSEMSGSGEAIVNIAIRLALGSVLTLKTFSVILADEVDASMDNDRASYVAECLKNLGGSFKQIILITHKQIDADHVIQI